MKVFIIVNECECGKEHNTIPGYAHITQFNSQEGIMWKCECNSTIFLPLAVLEQSQDVEVCG